MVQRLGFLVFTQAARVRLPVSRQNYYFYFIHSQVTYSQTSLIRTPEGQNQMSALQRCPYYRGRECMIFGICGTKRNVRYREVSVQPAQQAFPIELLRESQNGSQKKNGRGRGRGEEVPSFPSPSPVIPFFLLSSQLFSTNSRGNACYAGQCPYYRGVRKESLDCISCF